MGKWSVVLTFLLSLALITAGWYLLRPGEPKPGLTLDPEPPPDAEFGRDFEWTLSREFTGLVHDRTTAAPVRDALVVVGEHETRTDDAGRWTLSLPVGLSAERQEFDFVVRAEGYLTGRNTLTFDPLERKSRESVVSLRRAAKRVVGRVFDHRGLPVLGADVAGTTTNELGRFGPIPVALGRLTLTAMAPGRPAGTVHIVVRHFDPAERTVVINLPEPDPALLRVMDSGGAPISGVEIRRNRHEGPVGHTDDSGSFLRNLARGTGERLWLTKERYLPATAEVFAGTPTEVRLERGSLVSGRVLLADGTPVGAGITVEEVASGPSRLLPPARTDAAGRFRLTASKGEAVRLRVRWRNTLCGEFDFPAAAGMDLTGLEIRLEKPIVRTVVVRELKLESPVEGAEVVGGWPDPASRTTTDADGKARVLVPPKSAHLPAAFIPVRVRREGWLEALGQIHLDDDREVFVKLSRKTAVIVTVVDGKDGPVEGAMVEVLVGRRTVGTGHTDAMGRATPDAPFVGRFVVRASHPAHRRVEKEGDRNEMRVVLPRKPPPWVLAVQDAAGRPVVEALVEPTEAEGSRGPVRAVPETGRLGIERNVREVRVSAPGFETVLVRAAQGEPRTVTLRPGIDLSVEVLDRDGHPITNAAVEAFGPDDDGLATGTVPVDTRGVAVLRGVPADSAIRIRAIGFGGWETRQVFSQPGEKQVSVPLARFGRIRVTFPEALAGDPVESIVRALDRPITDMEYRRHDKRRLTKPASEFVYGAPAGPVAFWFRCGKGAWQVWPRVEVRSSDPLELEYTAPPPGRLKLTVKGPDGKPVEAAQVFACGVGQHVAWTSPAGTIPAAKAADIPNGLVRFFIRHEGYATVVTEPLDLAVGAELTVTMPEGGRIDGVLLDRDGQRVRGQVRALIHSGFFENAYRTNADGEFRMKCHLAEGLHQVEVRAHGRVPVLREVRATDGTRSEVELWVD